MNSLLIESALRALLLAALVGGGLQLFRVKNVQAQKLAWTLVLAASILMPLAARWQIGARIALPAVWHRMVAQPVSAAEPVIAPEAAIQGSDPASAAAAGAPAEAQISAVPPRNLPAPPARRWQLPQFTPRQISWMIYGAVLVVLFARLLAGLLAALWMWRRAQAIDRLQLPLWGREFEALPLRVSSQAHTPLTIGNGVLLPADYAQWDEAKLRIVLAHEQAHVRQGDFFLQLIAGIHAAIFWFSPLGWWLKTRLSDLSEAISDRAGMHQAADAPSYAQILLEFATRPSPAYTGVAMARSSNLSRRIERLLSEHHFAQAFAGGRLRMIAAVLVVPVALIAATAAVRVQAAAPALAQEPAQQKVVAATVPDGDKDAAQSGQTTVTVQAGNPEAAGTPSGDKQMSFTLQAQKPQASGKAYSFTYGQDSNGDSHAFVVNHGESLNIHGDWDKNRQKELEEAQKKAHGNFLWFTRDGKSYIVDDPAVTDAIARLYGPVPMHLQALTEEDRAKLEKLKNLSIKVEMDKVILPPDFAKKVEEISRSMAKMQERLHDGELAQLESKLAGLQEQLKTVQSQVARVHMEDAEKLSAQAQELASKANHMANLHIQMLNKHEADQQVQSIIEQSLKDGKARPVE